MSQEPEPAAEPTVQSLKLDPSLANDPNFKIPEEHQQLFQPPAEGETFAQQRARMERQTTLLFKPAQPLYGPDRPQEPRATPYSGKPLSSEDEVNATVDVDIIKELGLPNGWLVENGMLTMDTAKDEWKLEGNYLTRKHYVPRFGEFKPNEENCPLPLHYLMKDRYSKMGPHLVRDKWTRPSVNKKLNTGFTWTGYTRFKICPAWRKEAKKVFLEKSEGKESMFYNETKPTSNAPLSERNMNLDDRLAFMEAKQKELESFFQNQVWLFDDDKNAPADRILKARFILTWKKHEDGTPRAKARLVVQGFRDPDAHLENLSTASPTLTRLSRNFIMSVATMMGMTLFTSDISTAFLQGRNFDPNSNRIIWVKLPRDGEELLGLPQGHGKLMKLVKPMYGLCDAPRAWFEEATSRILKMGNGAVVQHPLDACLFLAYDKALYPPPAEGEPEPRLLALFGIHVDDIFGCYHETDEHTDVLLKNLKGIFNFREWVTAKDKDEMEYCGAQITKVTDNHWKIHHGKYLAKQKPITYPKERQGSNDEVTDRERTALRGLIGGLQWPAVQSSPHLQCMVSTLAGQVSKATTSTLDAANRCLRFAKQNGDVGLEFRHIGPKDEITFAAYSDASFASRDDLSSQGGYFIVMVHKDVTTGGEGAYNVIDWRSWKLARVSRSTLAAESQAASEAADALLFVTTFWQLVWKPWLPLDDLKTAQITNSPKLVVDAKALYDLLIKEEIQAGNNTDKRTAIEVLVTQDKLRCCRATTMWVSSELQYADGLTKGSASQLLADRLRSHLTRLRSDEDFVASKKKTASERKKGAERYAIRKPTSATMTTTMFAAFCNAAVMAMTNNEPYNQETAETYNQEKNNTYLMDTFNLEPELFNTIMFLLFGILGLAGFITTCRWVFRVPQHVGTALGNLWKVMSLKEAKAPEGKDAATQTAQTERDLIDDLNDLQMKILRLEAELDESQAQTAALQDSNNNLSTLFRDATRDRRQMIITAGQQQIYFTPEGRSWHASYQCLRNRTAGPIYHKTWCTACVDCLGQYPGNQAPDGETNSRLR